MVWHRQTNSKGGRTDRSSETRLLRLLLRLQQEEAERKKRRRKARIYHHREQGHCTSDKLFVSQLGRRETLPSARTRLQQ